MGQNLVMNMNDHGFTVAVFIRATSKVDEFLAGAAAGSSVIGTQSIEELVASLKGEESKLRAEVQRAQEEKKRLNAAIREIIEAELAAERASSAGEFALTPEGKIVSAAFESNRSSLPWPVMRGVMTGKFGRQPHPSLPGITIDNNGIDISTETGSSVLAVFGGTVSSVFDIPGAGQTIIHGCAGNLTPASGRDFLAPVQQAADKGFIIITGDDVIVGFGMLAGRVSHQ